MSDKEAKACFTIFCIMVLMIVVGLLFAIFELSTFYGGFLITTGIFGTWFLGEYTYRRRTRNKNDA